MRILICAVQFKGGSLQVAISLINEFRKFTDNEYHVIVSREVKNQLKESEFPSNFFFYDLPYPTNIRLLNLVLRRSFFEDIERTVKSDCVICTSGPLYWKPVSPLLMGYNLSHHLYPESPYFKRIHRWKKMRWRIKWLTHKNRYLKEASAIFVQTDDINERLKKALDFDNVYTISNTYNDAYRSPQKFPDKLPEHQPGEFRLLTLSAFYMHKNFEVIPMVIDELLKRGEGNVRFVVTLADEIYKALFKANYQQYVYNVGFVLAKEGPSLYQECDAMFLPTLLECFSASYAEAMVMHKPILTSDLGFAHTVCKDAAVYFDPDDAYDVADKIIGLINSRHRQTELVSRGIKQLEQFGTAEQRAARILDLCKMLINKVQV